MLRSVSSLAKALAFAVLCACTQPDPCEDADCGPGQCLPSSEQATCSCPQGYVPAGKSCQRNVREGDDHGDSFEAATPVEPMEPSQSVTANLDTPDDVDLFSFHVTAGRIYLFSCYGSMGGYTPNCKVTLLGADGLKLPGSVGVVTVSSFQLGVLATQGGTVYARVERYSSSSTFHPSYAYSLLDRGPDDFANTLTEATPVPVGTTLSGSVEPYGDVDVVALDAVAGRAYRLECRGATSSCGMRVRGPGGEVLYESRSGAPWRIETFDLQGMQEGRHTVELFLFKGVLYSTGTGGYTFSVADLEP
ncbi:hypothetical protein [Corallococcus terminator]|uniref:EGF-like domain-containing protein n=1 Tax=Corallococcus terminator TaxID=2316733 RepID=A0A3A8JA72_9BACT|nr:hypothetical protein [Corallococcus terminator]RKG88730.1 hypothetical protein D7V88_13800 [Corallococcus terminator]